MIPATLGLSALLILIVCLAWPSAAQAQQRPYIGFAYPAGGQQGTTFQIRVGGQGLDEVQSVLITGAGVSGKVAENYRRINNEELQLLNEQLRVLRQESMPVLSQAEMMMADNVMMTSEASNHLALTVIENAAAAAKKEAVRALIDRIEKRTLEYVPNPACPSIASLVIIEISVSANAEPGDREIRLATLRGVSNPLDFRIDQVPEFIRKPMVTATKQVLGKEADALRKRLPGQEEQGIHLPCTVNGQIASGEVDRYRFEARQGQRLVIRTLARQLVPFIADAVPGWFQPVLVLYDANGKEVAYDDDYRFNPDPVILYEVPRDGEYVLTIHDSIYRGREDFVYRITIGELPFITSLFPLGARVAPQLFPGEAGRGGENIITAVPEPHMKGWNIEAAELTSLPPNAAPGTYLRAARGKGLVSNPVPFALDTLPEVFEQEANNTPAHAQKVTLPVIINGLIDRPDDWDVFEFIGKSNQTIVAEVQARRLDSPLDSVVKLTDANGNLLAFNDDHEDLASGRNTHQADSYFLANLPADGHYYIHIGDTARHGGDEFGYRLRLSAPRPDFDLRVVPSSLSLRSKSSAPLTVYVQRKDGFGGPIKLALKDPPAGFTAAPVTLAATQTVARLTVRTTLVAIEEPASLSVIGTAKMDGQDCTREAIPAEDKMQAFLWRHLVPAQDLRVLVFDAAYQPPPKRIPHARSPALAATNAPAPITPSINTNALTGTNAPGGTNLVAAASKPKFTKQQVAGRLKELKRLFEEGMLTDEFYQEKVTELEVAQ